MQTTPSSVELSVAPQVQAAADFSLWAEEKPGRNRPPWLRNAVEKPLSETDIEIEAS